MKKLTIIEQNNYDYVLIDNTNNKYKMNIEFYGDYKPCIGDDVYIDEKLLNEVNLYQFGEVYNTNNYEIDDFIKVVTLKKKEYYFQRQYG